MGAKSSKKCSHSYACGHSAMTNAADHALNYSNTNEPRKFSGHIQDERYQNGNYEIEPINTKARLLKEIKIRDGSTGHGYETLFGKYLDGSVTAVNIEDPYIRKPYQVQLMVRFCELLIRSCRMIETINLKTTREPESDNEVQEEAFAQLKDQLRKRGISLSVTFSPTLHDREIRFNNGYVIKIGRGLDYFKPVKNFTPGYFDLDLRPCNETTVNILCREP